MRGASAGTLEVMTDLSVSPVVSDPALDGDHERMAHIVLEGFQPDDGDDFVPAGHLAHLVRDTVREGLDLSSILGTMIQSKVRFGCATVYEVKPTG